MRRGSGFAVRKRHEDPRIKKRRTLHDSKNQRRPAIVLRRRGADDLTHGRPIVVLEPPAERVGQQLLGERGRELIGSLQQQRAKAREALDRRAAHRRADRIDRLAGFVDRAPAADGVEVLQRKARRIDHGVAAGAHRIACGAAPAARGSSAAPCRACISGSVVSTSGGGGGT